MVEGGLVAGGLVVGCGRGGGIGCGSDGSDGGPPLAPLKPLNLLPVGPGRPKDWAEDPKEEPLLGGAGAP
ncbi:MAG: hypothetical protein GY696_20200, partial [Gammaproteobacteria bacterium]|nr:hypothetical protein [Gammaproteobacteria bacterium]